jgi:hypothetical protein
MPYLVAAPEVMSGAAADIDGIGWRLNAANFAAASPTSDLAAAAHDEVSTAIAKLFGEYGRAYQTAVPQAASFHSDFARTLVAARATYADAEASASSEVGALQQDARTLTGGAAAPALMPAMATNVNAIVMGGSGNPVPSMNLVNGLLNYVPAGQFNVLSKLPLVTPEQLYPLTGIKSPPLTTSVSQGVTLLDQALFGLQGQLTLGHSALVVGVSQSSMISSLEMRNILNLPAGSQPSATQLGFTLMGDPMNPNGGLFARFPGLTLPSMGLEFYGATPSDTPWPTTIYSMQYDGFADFPRYPINILSDINAFAGILFVHPTYATVNPQTLPASDIVHLQTEPTYTGNTEYYMIVQNQNLPLLAPVAKIPFIGQPLVDLVQPDLRVLVNLGYGDPSFGYSTSYANVATSFGLFPHVSQGVIAADLAAGAQQGLHAFVADIASQGLPSLPHLSMPGPHALPTIPPLDTLLSPAAIRGFIDGLKTANTNVANAITSGSASAYAALLPTADTLNAALTSIPAYDVNLFLDGMAQFSGGDPAGLVNAVGYPIAADTALLVVATGFQSLVLIGGAAAIAKDLTGLIP